MAKLSKEKRDRLILVIVGGLAAIAGIWYGIIKTTNARLDQSKATLVSAKEKLEKGKERVKQRDQVEATMNAVVQRVRAIEDGMASQIDLLSWSYALLDKAKAGQDVEIIEVARPQTNEVGVLAAFPYTAATITIRGAAHYHDFGKFLADFENRFPYFRTQNLSLTPTGEAGPEVATLRSVREKILFRMDIVALIKPNQ